MKEGENRAIFPARPKSVPLGLPPALRILSTSSVPEIRFGVEHWEGQDLIWISCWLEAALAFAIGYVKAELLSIL